jgi:purine-binding chemotaxis protein CheW
MRDAAGHHVVTFRLEEDHFAADVHAVERVLRYRRPTPIPGLPDWLDGVVEYEARAVPVIDLRQRFGLPRVEPRSETRILVIAVGSEWVGAVVDAVLDVVRLAPENISPAPSLFRGLPAEYLRGLIRSEDRLIVYLDAERILSAHERLELERVAVGISADA